MSTKELRRKLEQLGRSSAGARNVLLKRNGMYASETHQEEGPADSPEAGAAGPHANEHPMTVMVDESTGNKYMRLVDSKGLKRTERIRG